METTESTEMVSYVATKTAILKIGLDVGGVRRQIKFEHHKVELDPETAAAFDKAIASNLRLRLVITKVDKAAAEKLAKEHMLRTSRKSAAKGGFNTQHIDEIKNLSNRDLQLQQMGASPEDANRIRDELSRDGLELTVPGSKPPSQFVPPEKSDAESDAAPDAVPDIAVEPIKKNPFAGLNIASK